MSDGSHSNETVVCDYIDQQFTRKEKKITDGTKLPLEFVIILFIFKINLNVLSLGN
jgi:hypothetical protein